MTMRLDAGRPSRFDDGLGASNVDRVVGLVADLAVDPRAVDDGVAALEGLGQTVRADVEAVPGPSRQDHGLVAVAGEPRARGGRRRTRSRR